MADPSAMLQRADTALREANSKKGGFGGFFSSVSKEDKYQEAIDLYIQAANALRTRRSYMEAGQAQEKAADVYRTKMGLEYGNDAATCFVDAAKAYSAANDYAAAVRCLESAINEYTRKGNFRRAAGFKDQQGDHYLNKLHDIPHAVECFKQAAQWNMDENAPALANGIKLKVANLLASESLRQYAEAKQLFEDVAMFYAKDKMMSSSAKTPFFMALLCTLAIGDLVIVDRTLAQYKQSDPAFESQRECRLIEDLLEAMQDGNVPGFEDKLFSWNQVSRLDELKKTLLLDAKNKIVGAAGGGGAAEDGDDEFA